MVVNLVKVCSKTVLESAVNNSYNECSERLVIMIEKHALLLLTVDGNMVLEQAFTSPTTFS